MGKRTERGSAKQEDDYPGGERHAWSYCKSRMFNVRSTHGPTCRWQEIPEWHGHPRGGQTQGLQHQEACFLGQGTWSQGFKGFHPMDPCQLWWPGWPWSQGQLRLKHYFPSLWPSSLRWWIESKTWGSRARFTRALFISKISYYSLSTFVPSRSRGLEMDPLIPTEIYPHKNRDSSTSVGMTTPHVFLPLYVSTISLISTASSIPPLLPFATFSISFLHLPAPATTYLLSTCTCHYLP